jgi:hypothetical protein
VIRVQLRDAIEIGREMFGTLEDPKDGAISTASERAIVLTMADGVRVRVPWSNVRCVLDVDPLHAVASRAQPERDPLDRPIQRGEPTSFALTDAAKAKQKKGKHSKP